MSGELGEDFEELFETDEDILSERSDFHLHNINRMFR